MSRAAQRPWGEASPPGKPRRGSWTRGGVRLAYTHPHLDATLLSHSWRHKRTTTARTPLVPWRRWPSRRPWPAAWDAQTPSAQPARACGLAGRSPMDIFESVWHRQPLLQAVIHSATQRRTTGARDRRHSVEEERESQRGVRGCCTTVYRVKVNVTLLTSVLQGCEPSGCVIKCEPKTTKNNTSWNCSCQFTQNTDDKQGLFPDFYLMIESNNSSRIVAGCRK